MSDQTIIAWSELVGRLVLNRDTTEELGHLDRLWIDPKTYQLLGVTCKSGFLGRHQHALTWSQVEVIGPDSVLVRLPGGVEPAKPEMVIDDVVGHEIWTDAGQRVGTVRDYRFDQETGDVVDFLFVSDGWQGLVDGVYRLRTQDVVSLGTKRLIATDAALQVAERVTAGFHQALARAAEFLKEDYRQTQDDISTWFAGGRAIARQLQVRSQPPELPPASPSGSPGLDPTSDPSAADSTPLPPLDHRDID